MASGISSNNIVDRISSEISSNSSTIMYGTVTITIRVHAEDTNLDRTAMQAHPRSEPNVDNLDAH